MADNIARISNYFILLPFEYRLERDCLAHEIFMCSDLYKILSLVNIRPEQAIFIENVIIEESALSLSELSGTHIMGGQTSRDSQIVYKLLTKLYYYSKKEPLYEDRFSFRASVISVDPLGPLYNHQNTVLLQVVNELTSSSLVNYVNTTVELKYITNLFQMVYNYQDGGNNLCKIEKIDVENEIKGELLFDSIYDGGWKEHFNVMRQYSCGILYVDGSFNFIYGLELKNGDLILSLCGINVYGLYSLKKIYEYDLCKNERSITIVRNSNLQRIVF
ncbi:MAG: hypothetical protein N2746_09475 [Deltaproteobacteria bacterium]|nr:hypothetical protein [Deltaproteobacteria bacterium]